MKTRNNSINMEKFTKAMSYLKSLEDYVSEKTIGIIAISFDVVSRDNESDRIELKMSIRKINEPETTKEADDKPPLGILPEKFYNEQRIRDLSDAINRYIDKGFFIGKYAKRIDIWCDELSRRLKSIDY